MKKIPAVLGLLLFWFAGSAAPATDGAALYKKSCGGCHGNKGTLTPGGSAPIRGLPGDVLLDKLAGYAEGRLGGPAGKPMRDAARKLPEGDRAVLAEHIGAL
ncbi:MAG: cytochrome C [Desulfovibrio sp.]|nr:cytochrome C [Desulfovibrio sp.]